MEDIEDTEIFRRNRKKLWVCVWRLLEKYHERVGLKVSAWSGPSGIWNPYLTFYFDSVRDDGKPVTEFRWDRGSGSMTMFQGHIGVSSLAGGRQLAQENQSKIDLGFDEISEWLESHLHIQESYRPHLVRIGSDLAARPHWKRQCERYLVSWGMLARYLGAQRDFVRLVNVSTSFDAAYGVPDHEEDAKRFLPEAGPEDILVFTNDIKGGEVYWLHTGKLYSRGGRCVDFYQRLKGGAAFREVELKVSRFFGASRTLAVFRSPPPPDGRIGRADGKAPEILP